jgi:hypothetical protein
MFGAANHNPSQVITTQRVAAALQTDRDVLNPAPG